MSLKDLINSRLEQSKKDTLDNPTDSVKAQPDNLQVRDTTKTKSVPTVNTDNYVFEDEAVKQTQPSESFLNRYVKARDKAKVLGPFPYESRFSGLGCRAGLFRAGIRIEHQQHAPVIFAREFPHHQGTHPRRRLRCATCHPA